MCPETWKAEFIGLQGLITPCVERHWLQRMSPCSIPRRWRHVRALNVTSLREQVLVAIGYTVTHAWRLTDRLRLTQISRWRICWLMDIIIWPLNMSSKKIWFQPKTRFFKIKSMNFVIGRFYVKLTTDNASTPCTTSYISFLIHPYISICVRCVRWHSNVYSTSHLCEPNFIGFLSRLVFISKLL